MKRPALVGRQAELEVLRGEIRRAAEGELRVVLVVGAAGVGKSRLMLESFASPPTAVALLTARSYRLAAAASFGPWLEALDRHARSDPSVVLAQALSTVGSDHHGRERIIEGIAAALHSLSERQPVVLGMDDFDLSDGSSWEALRFVCRRLWDRPVCIVATAREGRLAANVLATDVLLALDDDGLLRRLNLRPLNEIEVASLARHRLAELGPASAPASPPDALVKWLVDRSLGNPLFLNSLLDGLIAEGVDPAAPTLARVPERLIERVRAERAMLAPSDVDVLETLCVMDCRTSPQELARSLDWSLEDLAGPLERLRASSLVNETGTDADLAYEISHPLIRDCLYELMVGPRRLSLHRRIARTLLAVGKWGPAAGHFVRAASEPDDESLAALCDAIRQSEARGLYRETLAILAVLLETLPARDRRWQEVFRAISSHGAWVIDHLAEQDAEIGVAAIERIAEACHDAPAQERATMALYSAALLAIGAGRVPAAEAAALRAVALFKEAGDRSGSLLARNELAWIASCGGNLEAAVQRAGALLQDVGTGSDAAVEIQAAGSRAYALGLMGKVGAALSDYRRAEDRCIDVGNRYRLVWGLSQQTLVQALTGDLEHALRSAERAFSLDYTMAADAIGLERLAQCRWLQGNLHECVRLIEESGARRATRGSRRRAWGLAVSARAWGEMGNVGRARRSLSQATETYGDAETLDWSAWCPWTDGFLSHCEGRVADALRQHHRAERRYAQMGALAPLGHVQFDTVAAAVDCGEPEEASAASARLEATTEAVEGELHALLSALARVMCGAAASPVESAAGVRARLEELGYRLLAVTATQWEGICRERARAGAGLDVLDQAARMADACGAVWRRDRILAAMARMGTRGRRMAGALLGPASLTQREHEVASLAAQGHSARQIGKRLFIGARTVESHLACIYPKLGVKSKQELISRAQELGLTERP